MALLGLDFFESKKDRKLKNDAYNHLFFPYGDLQHQKIEELLFELFPHLTKQEAMFNYIVTKQKLMENDYIDTKDLINDLSNRYMSKNVDTKLYITLAQIDLHINQDLNYPNIEDIKTQATKY